LCSFRIGPLPHADLTTRLRENSNHLLADRIARASDLGPLRCASKSLHLLCYTGPDLNEFECAVEHLTEPECVLGLISCERPGDDGYTGGKGFERPSTSAMQYHPSNSRMS